MGGVAGGPRPDERPLSTCQDPCGVIHPSGGGTAWGRGAGAWRAVVRPLPLGPRPVLRPGSWRTLAHAARQLTDSQDRVQMGWIVGQSPPRLSPGGAQPYPWGHSPVDSPASGADRHRRYSDRAHRSTLPAGTVPRPSLGQHRSTAIPLTGSATAGPGSTRGGTQAHRPDDGRRRARPGSAGPRPVGAAGPLRTEAPTRCPVPKPASDRTGRHRDMAPPALDRSHVLKQRAEPWDGRPGRG